MGGFIHKCSKKHILYWYECRQYDLENCYSNEEWLLWERKMENIISKSNWLQYLIPPKVKKKNIKFIFEKLRQFTYSYENSDSLPELICISN